MFYWKPTSSFFRKGNFNFLSLALSLLNPIRKWSSIQLIPDNHNIIQLVQDFHTFLVFIEQEFWTQLYFAVCVCVCRYHDKNASFKGFNESFCEHIVQNEYRCIILQNKEINQSNERKKNSLNICYSGVLLHLLST